MNRHSKICITLTAVFLILTLCSCSSIEVRKTTDNKIGNGPPAHAKAHGYRRKHSSGVELVFESKSGVYVVVGMPNHYYCGTSDNFYRLGPDGWQASASFDGNWKYVDNNSLPAGLKGKKLAKNNQPSLASAKNPKK